MIRHTITIIALLGIIGALYAQTATAADPAMAEAVFYVR